MSSAATAATIAAGDERLCALEAPAAQVMPPAPRGVAEVREHDLLEIDVVQLPARVVHMPV